MPYFHKWQLQESEIGLHIINRPSPDCVELVLNKEAQLAVVNDYEGLRDNPQLEVTTLATIQDVFVGGPDYKGQDSLIKGAFLMSLFYSCIKALRVVHSSMKLRMVHAVNLVLNLVASMYC